MPGVGSLDQASHWFRNALYSGDGGRIACEPDQDNERRTQNNWRIGCQIFTTLYVYQLFEGRIVQFRSILRYFFA